jgi:hypothetical protein
MKGALPNPADATLEERIREAETKKQAIRNADARFQHKRMDLTGKVLDSGKTPQSLGLYVSVEVSGAIPIHANFFGRDKEAVAFALKLKKGDMITVLGTCGGYQPSGVVALGRCIGVKLNGR